MELHTIIDDHEFLELINGMRGRISSFTPAMRMVGQVVLESIDKTFADEGRPAKWQPLAERTLQAKSAGQKILEGDSHRLREGIHIQEVGSDYVDIAPDDLPYARIQQLGGDTGFGHQAHIPARPYLVIQTGDNDRIRDIITDYILQ